MDTLFVRPTPGARVRDPATGVPIPESGALVPNNGFWQRRIRTGDVVISEASAPRTAAPTKTAKSKE